MNSVERQRQHFENISEKYYHARQTSNHLLLKDLMWKEFFKDKAYLGQSIYKVLEPMCGYAEGKSILEKYLGKHIQYSGFDYNQKLIHLVKTQNPKLDIWVMDITQFKSDQKYDLVIIIGGLHHVPHYTKEIVKKISEVLVNKGYVILFEPTHNQVFLKKIREFIYRKNPLFDLTEKAFELHELNKIFLSNDFQIKDQIYPGLLTYILYYNPDAFPKLNIGGRRVVNMLFRWEKIFFRTIVGRKFSFATLTLFQKSS